jgi:hypothetical protein
MVLARLLLMLLKCSIIAALFATHAGLLVASPADAGSAVLVNSGSTNTPGFKIVVPRDGAAEYTAMPRAHSQSEGQHVLAPMKRKLPPALVHRLFSDLEAARPFSDLPRPTCMKSVSFGTRLTIQFNGDETPDLNCGAGQSTKLAALIDDAKQIVAMFSAH